MGILDNLTSTPAERPLSKVVRYAVTVEPHTDKQGRRSVGFKVYPVLDSGQAARFGDLWVRVSEGPEALDALDDSLDTVRTGIRTLRAKMEAAGEWTPRAAKAPATKAPATKATPAPAKKSALDDILGDLPA